MIALLAACALFVVDGDTVRCGQRRGGELIRLLGIDAPEMPGHCRRGRVCAPGDPVASKASLQAAVRAKGRVTIERHGKDRYGRTLAFVRIGRRDLSCHQLRQGAAIYREDWDWGARLDAICR